MSGRFGCPSYPLCHRYPFSLVYRIICDSAIELVAVADSERMGTIWRREPKLFYSKGP